MTTPGDPTVTYQVGQEVWVQLDRRGGGYQKIAKIGRKWATLDGHKWHPMRFDIETGWIDGGEHISPGRVYPSRETFELSVQEQSEWKDWYLRLQHRKPEHITLADIAELRRITRTT